MATSIIALAFCIVINFNTVLDLTDILKTYMWQNDSQRWHSEW